MKDYSSLAEMNSVEDFFDSCKAFGRETESTIESEKKEEKRRKAK